MTSSIMKMNNDDPRQTSLSDTATLHFTLTDQVGILLVAPDGL